MESAVSIATGDTVDLSEADLHFCSSHGASCGGWWPSHAIEEASRRGVPPEERFPYERDGGGATCKLDPHRDERLYRPGGQAELATMNERKQWLATRGPVCAAFHVYDDFFPWGAGIYRHVTGGHAGYHCVEVIGLLGHRSVLDRASRYRAAGAASGSTPTTAPRAAAGWRRCRGSPTAWSCGGSGRTARSATATGTTTPTGRASSSPDRQRVAERRRGRGVADPQQHGGLVGRRERLDAGPLLVPLRRLPHGDAGIALSCRAKGRPPS